MSASLRSYPEMSFTSESVTEGHPDKIADQISDSVLDAILAQDPNGRVACETLVTTGIVVVARRDHDRRHTSTSRRRPRDDRANRLHARQVRLRRRDVRRHRRDPQQSPDIAQGVDGEEQRTLPAAPATRGSCSATRDETEELMPLPIMLAHKLAQAAGRGAQGGRLPTCGPDGKSQVTVEYEVDEQAASARSRSSASWSRPSTREGRDKTRRSSGPHRTHDQADHPDGARTTRRADDEGLLYVNPTGKFVGRRPARRRRLTGRKIIVDTYGGARRTAAARSPARTRRRSIARPRTARATSRRTSSRRASPSAPGPARLRHRRRGSVSILVDTRHRQDPRRADHRRSSQHFDLRRAASCETLDLRRPIYRDGRLRPLRPRRARVHLGAHRQGRRAPRGRRARHRSRGLVENDTASAPDVSVAAGSPA